MKVLLRLFFVLVLVGLAFLSYRHFFPNEEARIRETLAGLAKAASVPAKASPLSAAMSLDRIRGCFTPDVEVNVQLLGESGHTFSGRDEVMETMKAVWARAQNTKVEFVDVAVKVDGSGQMATSELTLRVSRPGDSDFIIQEFRLELKKHEGDWRISKAQSVKALK